jgi:hypothetical protein
VLPSDALALEFTLGHRPDSHIPSHSAALRGSKVQVAKGCRHEAAGELTERYEVLKINDTSIKPVQLPCNESIHPTHSNVIEHPCVGWPGPAAEGADVVVYVDLDNLPSFADTVAATVLFLAADAKTVALLV